MKGALPITAIIVVLLTVGIIVASGPSFEGIANIFRPAEIISVGGQQCTVKEGLSVLPQTAYYACRPLGLTTTDYAIPNSGLTDIGSTWSKQCSMYTTQCTCTLMEKKDGVYKALSSITVNRGDYCNAQRWPTGERIMRFAYQPYSLYLEGSGTTVKSGFVNQNVWGCNVPAGVDYCLGGVLCDADAQQAIQTLDFDQNSNFVAGWAISPNEFSFVKYNNQDKYCVPGTAGGEIWSVGTVKLVSGCYAYPQAFENTVTCCPGQVKGSATCSNEFKYVEPTSENIGCGKISAFQCPGQGSWITDYSDINRKTVVKYTVDSEGCCVPETKTTGCSTNEGCTQGKVCMLNSATGVGSCATSGTPDTTPRAPNVIPADMDIWSLITNFIAAVIIAAIILGILLIVNTFVPIFRFIPFLGAFLNKLRDPKTFLIASVLLGVVILLLWTGLVLSVSGMIFGG